MSNKMSKDRIEFNLPAMNRYYGQSYCNAKLEADDRHRLNAAAWAFGISVERAYELSMSQEKIRVRPSQFARYMVKAYRNGAKTQFSAMSPDIVIPKVEVVDLSTNPAN